MIYLLLNTILWASPQDNTTVEDIEQNDIEDSGSSEQEEPSATDVTMANPPIHPSAQLIHPLSFVANVLLN